MSLKTEKKKKKNLIKNKNPKIKPKLDLNNILM